MQHARFLNHTVHLEPDDGIRMLLLLHPDVKHLQSHQCPIGLHTTRRGTRTGTDQRTQYQQNDCERSPQVGVGRSEAGSRCYGNELERRETQR